MIDGEVRQMVEEAYQRTIALMEEKKEQVKLVAELLLKNETISHTDVADLIGERYAKLWFLFLFEHPRLRGILDRIRQARNMIVMWPIQDQNRQLAIQLPNLSFLLLHLLNRRLEGGTLRQMKDLVI